MILDAYVTRSGKLFVPLAGTSNTGFQMVGNSGAKVGRESH